MRARRSSDAGLISFLDVMCCGFGAVILLVVILNSNVVQKRAQQSEDLRGELQRVTALEVFARNELARTSIEVVDVEISVVLGRSVLPMSQLLRMGRGAVIPLDASESDEVWILANNYPVARGEIEIREDRIAITVTRAADVYDFMAGAA